VTKNRKTIAASGLLFNACFWGILWFPMRLLNDAGATGAGSTLLVYLIASLIFALIRPNTVKELMSSSCLLVLIGLLAGWGNVGFVIGMIDGEVIRVTILFYLSPLWTMLSSRVLLGEKLRPIGWLTVFSSLIGMLIMIWRPGQGLFLPNTASDWMGLSAGVSFALCNVLTRKAEQYSLEVKALSGFAGMATVAAAAFLTGSSQRIPMHLEFWQTWGVLLLVLGTVSIVSSLGIQVGLKWLTASQAGLILMFELLVTAVSASVLTGERMSLLEWLGGALIMGSAVAASCASDAAEPPPAARTEPPGHARAKRT
jgi:drug/metabolite transporter (DMT)-like permease